MTASKHRGSALLIPLFALWLGACATADDPMEDSGTSNRDGSSAMDAARCTSNMDCPTARPFCETSTGSCGACTVSPDSCGTGRACDPNTRVCVMRCRSDTDCHGSTPTVDAGRTDARTDGSVDAGAPYTPGAHCLQPDGRCVDCMTTTQCPLGQVCMNNSCVAGCDAIHACPTGMGCCSNRCIDTQRDNMNCGACGRACASPAGTCCAGRCTDTSTDGVNCGACGTTCMLPHALSRCATGRCSLTSCEMGWSDTDMNPANGCECSADTRGAMCASPVDMGSVAMGGMQMATGSLQRMGDERFYRVTFSGMGAVQLALTPSMMGAPLRFDVLPGCGMGAMMGCTDRTQGASGLTAWDFRDNPPMDMGGTMRNVPYPTTVYVRVYLTAAFTGCASFTLVARN